MVSPGAAAGLPGRSFVCVGVRGGVLEEHSADGDECAQRREPTRALGFRVGSPGVPRECSGGRRAPRRGVLAPLGAG